MGWNIQEKFRVKVECIHWTGIFKKIYRGKGELKSENCICRGDPRLQGADIFDRIKKLAGYVMSST